MNPSLIFVHIGPCYLSWKSISTIFLHNQRKFKIGLSCKVSSLLLNAARHCRHLWFIVDNDDFLVHYPYPSDPMIAERYYEESSSMAKSKAGETEPTKGKAEERVDIDNVWTSPMGVSSLVSRQRKRWIHRWRSTPLCLPTILIFARCSSPLLRNKKHPLFSNSSKIASFRQLFKLVSDLHPMM